MNKIEVLSEWVMEIPGDPLSMNHPKISDDYPYNPTTGEGIFSRVDVTNTPAENLSPNPNQVVLSVICDDTTLALLEADINYDVLYVDII